ncbi:hypothetical protein [Marininema halotolerans]|uniref:Uncharacterized protein n=1 Tax=Marininema halotolerans TaxID=1155944 RepID=A0A1I6SZM5_9BACL|nr:hypothetical protein [Marininema halotolerans]SFS82300.1 hypothetical protein SAMN05444972_108151 [Marininema halotolerans]
MTIAVQSVNAKPLAEGRVAWSVPYTTGLIAGSEGVLGRGDYHTGLSINNPSSRPIPVMVQILPATPVGVTTQKKQVNAKRVIRRVLTAGETLVLAINRTGPFSRQKGVTAKQRLAESGSAIVYGRSLDLQVTVVYSRTTTRT